MRLMRGLEAELRKKMPLASTFSQRLRHKQKQFVTLTVSLSLCQFLCECRCESQRARILAPFFLFLTFFVVLGRVNYPSYRVNLFNRIISTKKGSI